MKPGGPLRRIKGLTARRGLERRKALARGTGLRPISDKTGALTKAYLDEVRPELIGKPCAFPGCTRPATSGQHAAGREGLAEDGSPRMTYAPWILPSCHEHNTLAESDPQVMAEGYAVGFKLARVGDPYRLLDPARSAEWRILPPLFHPVRVDAGPVRIERRPA